MIRATAEIIVSAVSKSLSPFVWRAQCTPSLLDVAIDCGEERCMRALIGKIKIKKFFQRMSSWTEYPWAPADAQIGNEHQAHWLLPKIKIGSKQRLILKLQCEYQG